MYRLPLSRAADHAHAYLDDVRERPVCATTGVDALKDLLGGPMPEQGQDPLLVIDRLAAAGREGTMATQGPRYFGFVVGGSVPAATAADWLVSAWDQNAGLFVLSPIVSVVEDVVASWLRDLIALPATWSTGFVTGGQMANATCLATARHHVLREAGWDVERQGLFGAPPVDVIVGDEAHYTIFTSLRLLGLGADRVRRVATDGQGRMRADDLERVLAGASGPCIICAQAGNVNTGSFDPLPAIVPLARARGAWLHVDAAFGLWAAVSSSRHHLVTDIARADSIATDAHKWLNVPYDCGIAMTAHRDSHRRAMFLAAEYIQETASARDPHEFTPEESRRGRAVPVYAALRSLGRAGLTGIVDRCCDLARIMAARLEPHPRVRILNDVVLNQVLVRCVPASGGAAEADALTARVIADVQREGTCWLGGTTWHGQTAIRISVSNWSTTEADIERAAAAILAAVDRSSS